jgi:hypothetical protein
MVIPAPIKIYPTLKFIYKEPLAKVSFLFKIKACVKFYHRHIIDIARIKFIA